MQYRLRLLDHPAVSSNQQWLADAEIEFGDDGEPQRMRIDTVLSWLKSDSFETIQTSAGEALAKWVRSGNDPMPLRRTQISWRNPMGEVETDYVGAVADR